MIPTVKKITNQKENERLKVMKSEKLKPGGLIKQPGIKLPDGVYVQSWVIDDQQPDETLRGEWAATIIISDDGNKISRNPEFTITQTTSNSIVNGFDTSDIENFNKIYDKESKQYIDTNSEFGFRILSYDTNSKTGNTQTATKNGNIYYGSIYSTGMEPPDLSAPMVLEEGVVELSDGAVNTAEGEEDSQVEKCIKKISNRPIFEKSFPFFPSGCIC